jgi:hypothetical protein
VARGVEEARLQARATPSLWGALRRRLDDTRSRPTRFSRPLRTTLRTLHLLAFGALYGGHVFGVEAERLLPALIAVVASGLAFTAFEVWRAPIWLVQVRGAATGAKLGLLLLVDPCWDYRVAILSLVAGIGVVVAHMPGHYRYYSFLHGCVMGGGEKG